MRGAIESLFDANAISKATVQVRRWRSGKFVIYQCSHKELEMVEMAVENIMSRTDKSLQPVAACAKKICGMWRSDVSFYANADDVPEPFVPHRDTACLF